MLLVCGPQRVLQHPQQPASKACKHGRLLLSKGQQGPGVAGENSFEGFTPEVPEGEKLDYASQAFEDYEQKGEV